MHDLPNVIIAGAIRCATTSLYTYLSLHDDICASSKKETNYFLPITLGDKPKSIEVYRSYFRHYTKCKYKYLMEASPGYIYGGKELASAIYECLGPVKVIFLFRNPMDRLYSHYNYLKKMRKFENRLSDMSFEEYVNRGLDELGNGEPKNKEYFNIYRETIFVAGIAAGMYADYLVHWYSVFGDSMKVRFLEDLRQEPFLFMDGLCEWLGIDSVMYESYEFSIENRGIAPRSALLHNVAASVNVRFERVLRKHHRVKGVVRRIYCLFNESRKTAELLSDHTYSQLESLYSQYNARLLSLLSSKGYSTFPGWLKKGG